MNVQPCPAQFGQSGQGPLLDGLHVVALDVKLDHQCVDDRRKRSVGGEVGLRRTPRDGVPTGGFLHAALGHGGHAEVQIDEDLAVPAAVLPHLREGCQPVLAARFEAGCLVVGNATGDVQSARDQRRFSRRGAAHDGLDLRLVGVAVRAEVGSDQTDFREETVDEHPREVALAPAPRHLVELGFGGLI